MTKKKNNLIEALSTKFWLLTTKYNITKDEKDLQEINQVIKELSKWINVNEDTKCSQIHSTHQKLTTGVINKSLKELQKDFNDNPTKEKYIEFIEHLKETGWSHWIIHYTEKMISEYPQSYALL